MTEDLTARLDRAITEAWADVIVCAAKMTEDDKIDGWQGNVNVNMALDRYAALVAVRARYEGYVMGWNDLNESHSARKATLDAEAERLLSGEAG